MYSYGFADELQLLINLFTEWNKTIILGSFALPPLGALSFAHRSEMKRWTSFCTGKIKKNSKLVRRLQQRCLRTCFHCLDSQYLMMLVFLFAFALFASFLECRLESIPPASLWPQPKSVKYGNCIPIHFFRIFFE